MDASNFISQLNWEISQLSYVNSVDITLVEEQIVKGRIDLKKSYHLMLRFNGYKFGMSFALLYQNQRIWGLDYDTPNGWHLHPLYQTEKHEKIEEQTIAQIFVIFESVWQTVEKDSSNETV